MKVRIIPISATLLDEIDLCEHFYYLRRKRRIVPFNTSERLERGSVLHKILATHYTIIGINMGLENKISYQEIIEKSVENGLAESVRTDLSHEDIELVVNTYRAYANYWQHDGWYPVVDGEGKPIVEAPFTKVLYEGPGEDDEIIRIVVFGKIDLLLFRPSNGERVVIDHKSGARYVALNPLGNQYFTYAWASGILKVGQNNAGFQDEGNKNKFRRDYYTFQKDQIEEWVDSTVRKVLLMDAMSKQDFYPRRTTGCFKYGPCQYINICAAIPGSREAIVRMQYKEAPGHDVYKEETVEEPNNETVAV